MRAQLIQVLSAQRRASKNDSRPHMSTVSSLITAEWRDLVMLSYEIDPLLLVPLVPRGTSLDFFDGRTIVTVTGFRFLDTRIAGVPLPLHRDFEQVNFRFYVWRQAGSDIRRGSVFITEIVPSLTLTIGARVFYNENYLVAPMRHEVVNSEQGWASYEWQLGQRWHRISARRNGLARTMPPQSFESFIKDRPWGYTRQRDGSTVELHAEHPSWDIWEATEPRLECDIPAVFGPQFATTLARPPISAFIAVGSTATLHPGHRLD